MSDRSNRVPPVPQPFTGGTNDTATSKGPQRPDNEPQVAPEDMPQANHDASETVKDGDRRS